MLGQPPSSSDETPSEAHPAGPQYESGLNRSIPADSAGASRRVKGRTRAEKPAAAQTATERLAEVRRGAAVPPNVASDPPERPAKKSTQGDGMLAAGQVLMAGLVALALAAVLNADALVRDAERLEFGTSRDVSLAVWEPVQSVSDALSLTEPRRIFDEALGRDYSEVVLVPATIAAGAAPGTTSAPPSDPTDSTSPAATTAPAATTTLPTTTVPTTTTTETPRIPTPVDQLTVWVGGDSMAQVFGESLVRLGTDTRVITPTLDYRISSGLTRPDFFNWPARLTDVITNDDPEVMVVIFGANDAQGMELSNGVFQPFEDEWVAEYSMRVGFVMDILTQDPDRLVIWVGQPIMRSNNFDTRMNTLNGIYLDEAQSRPRIVYMDTRAMFSNSSGEYEAFLPALNGEIRNLRQQDGTHLSRAGGDVLADAVLDQLRDYIDIDSGRLPSATSTTAAG